MLGAVASAENAPAFPGAEGHGRYTTGGRSETAKIIHVTNLNDSGEGSFRQAVTTSGPKIIVFDVSGYIDLKSNVKLNSNTTILGQTAPAGGITLRYYTLEFTGGDNIIVRFIRSRRSQVKDVNDGADAAWGRRRHDIIIDHCSFSWSIDEVASFYDNRNFTLQWSTCAEGLCNPGHSKGAHSYCGIWGGKEASFHHNFMAHIQNRVPRFNGARYEWDGYDRTKYGNTVQAEIVDFRNNLMYNWGNGNGSYGGPGGGYINIVNSYYKAGPGTVNKKRVTQVSVGSSGNSTNTALLGYASRYYISGNYVTAAEGDAANYDWKGVSYDSGLSLINGERYIPDAKHLYGDGVTYVKDNKDVDCVRLRIDEPVITGEVSTHEAGTAYNKVMNYAGASLWRDDADARYMEECRTGTVTYYGDEPFVDASGKTYAKSGTKGIVDWVNDPTKEQNPKVPSFPELPANTWGADFDTDGDGIPDAFETANGLDPNNPADAKLFTLDPRGWYMNIEVYANSLVENLVKWGNQGAIDAVDEYFPPCNFVDVNNTNTSAVDKIEYSGEIREVQYFDLNGIRLQEPCEGISIRRIIYSNGTTSTDKVLKR
ncbi:MAG: pectate lyase [Duncaniella sp.]|nr:pectate lyase [Duncaniella sp.]